MQPPEAVPHLFGEQSPGLVVHGQRPPSSHELGLLHQIDDRLGPVLHVRHRAAESVRVEGFASLREHLAYELRQTPVVRLPQIVGVDEVQLIPVEPRRRLVHVGDVEPGDSLLVAEDLRVP
jgi:hypothetical protein